jgi:transposase
MKHYAGIDVSLEYASVRVVDASGKIVREGKVASEPVTLITWLGSLGVNLERIGLEGSGAGAGTAGDAACEDSARRCR